MIRDPVFLLLDEPTSALDSVNERIVQEALDAMMDEKKADGTRLTVIMVAHRLTTIKNCDKIIVMSKGAKVEEGTHAELLKIAISKDEGGATRTGWYRELWETQHGASADKRVDHNDRWIKALEARLRGLEAENAQLRHGAALSGNLHATSRLGGVRPPFLLRTISEHLTHTAGTSDDDDDAPAHGPAMTRAVTVT